LLSLRYLAYTEINNQRGKKGIVRHGPVRDFEELQEQRALLAALSDDLALPLLQIKTSADLIQARAIKSKELPNLTKNMALSAESGLQLIEAYRLALKIHNAHNLELEPVAVGSVLQDIAHQLTSYAKQYDAELRVDVAGKLRPVLAHKASLSAALQVLSASLIRAQAADTPQKRGTVLLAAHKSADTAIATGVFSSVQGLSDRTLRSTRALIGKARQPLNSVPAGAASGVLIADMLCGAMWQPLRAAAHRNMTGLVTAVPISKQLHFI